MVTRRSFSTLSIVAVFLISIFSSLILLAVPTTGDDPGIVIISMGPKRKAFYLIPVEFEIGVLNNNSLDEYGLNIHFYHLDFDMSSRTDIWKEFALVIVDIPANKRSNITVNWTPPSWGDVQVKVTIPRSDYELEETIYVEKSNFLIMVLKTKMPSVLSIGQNFTFAGNFSNPGEHPQTSSVWLRVYEKYSRGEIDDITFDYFNLEPKEMTDFSYNWTAPMEPGLYDVDLECPYCVEYTRRFNIKVIDPSKVIVKTYFTRNNLKAGYFLDDETKAKERIRIMCYNLGGIDVTHLKIKVFDDKSTLRGEEKIDLLTSGGEASVQVNITVRKGEGSRSMSGTIEGSSSNGSYMANFSNTMRLRVIDEGYSLFPSSFCSIVLTCLVLAVIIIVLLLVVFFRIRQKRRRRGI